MYISRRHFLKLAGEKEARFAKGINFSEIQSNNPSIDKDSINNLLMDPLNNIIKEPDINFIRSTNLDNFGELSKRTSENEKKVILVGIALKYKDDSQRKAQLERVKTYLEFSHSEPGSFGLESTINSIKSIESNFEKIEKKVSDLEREKERLEQEAKKNEYTTNIVKFDFGDGWKVVYLPAVNSSHPDDKDVTEYPGLPGTSHDRILEGNNNGLCLGSGMMYYQNNAEGKIYSVRDPGNKPRATIRIDGNYLQEAKGKNNGIPDIEAANKAIIWFESINGLDYKNNDDFLRFPPLTKEEAKEKFLKNKGEAYENGWVSHWYNRDLDIIDEDVENKILENDPILITSGFGKKYKELIEPVVKYWCMEYLTADKGYSYLFYNSGEAYKTYRKLPEMQKVVEKFSLKYHSGFLRSEMINIEEYKDYIDSAAKKMAEEDPYNFLRHLSEYPWAKPYINDAREKMAEKNHIDFLTEFSEQPWAEPYIGEAANKAAEKRPFYFLVYFSEKTWAKPYINKAAKKAAEENPFNFLLNFSEQPWAQPYIDGTAKKLAEKIPFDFLYEFSKRPWAQPYINEAAKKLAEVSPLYFLNNFSEKPWSKPYINEAAKKTAEKNHFYFLRQFSKEPWANIKAIEIEGKWMTWVEYAKGIRDGNIKVASLTYSNKNVNLKIIKLATLINNLGLVEYSKKIKEL